MTSSGVNCLSLSPHITYSAVAVTSSVVSNTPTLSTVSEGQDATGLTLGAVATVLGLIIVVVIFVVVVIVLRR